MTRCKPGDYAKYIGIDEKQRGKVVVVVAPFTWHEPAWRVYPPLDSCEFGGKRYDGRGVLDRALCPIRPAPSQVKREALDLADVPAQ